MARQSAGDVAFPGQSMRTAEPWQKRCDFGSEGACLVSRRQPILAPSHLQCRWLRMAGALVRRRLEAFPSRPVIRLFARAMPGPEMPDASSRPLRAERGEIRRHLPIRARSTPSATAPPQIPHDPSRLRARLLGNDA